VNTVTTGVQIFPHIAVEPDGDFQVVWIDIYGAAPELSDVFGQRYDRAGAPRGGDFLVNTYTTSFQGYFGGADVAADREGRFVVVWWSFGEDGSYTGIFGQRYDAAGTRQGAPFQVNTYTTGGQSDMTESPTAATATVSSRRGTTVTVTRSGWSSRSTRTPPTTRRYRMPPWTPPATSSWSGSAPSRTGT
jgi:hypothetical protein